MGYYTFLCNSCGEFTEWHKSILGQKDYAFCPNCQHEAARVFKPPLALRMDSSLKKRIERGMEPRIVCKNKLQNRNVKRNGIQKRPWQVGH